MHESKFPFVSRIEFIRSKLSNFSAHVYGVYNSHPAALVCHLPSPSPSPSSCSPPQSPRRGRTGSGLRLASRPAMPSGYLGPQIQAMRGGGGRGRAGQVSGRLADGQQTLHLDAGSGSRGCCKLLSRKHSRDNRKRVCFDLRNLHGAGLRFVE